MTALDRAAELLAPGAGPGRRDAGYLDLLGGEDRAAPRRLAPRLMESTVLPAVYERWWRPAWGRLFKGGMGGGMEGELRMAHELLALGPGDRVLDLACGPGNFTRSFARTVAPGGLAVGIDASATMLARAVRDTPAGGDGAAYVRGDAERLPFADASFDALCCFAALNLFADPMLALDHAARVLKPGGRIAIFTSCGWLPGPAGGAVRAAAATTGVRVFGRDEVTGALAARGFADVRRKVAGMTQFVGARRG